MSRKTSQVATPRAYRTLVVRVGPISVEVGLKAFTADEKIHAKTLCPDHMSPVKQAWVCDAELHPVEAPIKRFEYAGAYVEVDPKEFEAEGDNTVELTAAPPAESLDPVYFEKPYLIWPKAGYEGQFDMLAASVRESGRTLIGFTVLTKSTRVFAVTWSPTFNCLVAHVLTFDENVCRADIDLVVGAQRQRPEAPRQYVDLLTELITSAMPDTFDAAAYTDDYRAGMRKAIEAAAAGAPVPKRAAVKAEAPAADLLAALQASVDAGGKKPKPSARKPAAKPVAKKPAARTKATR